MVCSNCLQSKNYNEVKQQDLIDAEKKFGYQKLITIMHDLILSMSKGPNERGLTCNKDKTDIASNSAPNIQINIAFNFPFQQKKMFNNMLASLCFDTTSSQCHGIVYARAMFKIRQLSMSWSYDFAFKMQIPENPKTKNPWHHRKARSTNLQLSNHTYS